MPVLASANAQDTRQKARIPVRSTILQNSKYAGKQVSKTGNVEVPVPLCLPELKSDLSLLGLDY